MKAFGFEVNVEDEIENYRELAKKIKPFVCETVSYLHEVMASDKKVFQNKIEVRSRESQRPFEKWLVDSQFVATNSPMIYLNYLKQQTVYSMTCFKIKLKSKLN